ncbi:hypothetical protein [uncultured Algimonas sp.]|uniref:hypothetical protein n=1 Tax=uncultured Algimonas sp. TaxID=1547920 RepID=UPI00261C7221|nr:hypothetical protein [uncultured Algimonas sp.]
MKQILLSLSLLLSAALSGCAGFQPMHAMPSAGTVFSDLGVSVGPGRDEADRLAGFVIRQSLADRIDAPADPTYTVHIEPTQQRAGVGLTTLDAASRFDGIVTAQWTLTRRRDGQRIASGSTSSTSSFSANIDPSRLQATADAALERAASNVANELIQELTMALADFDKDQAVAEAEAQAQAVAEAEAEAEAQAQAEAQAEAEAETGLTGPGATPRPETPGPTGTPDPAKP